MKQFESTRKQQIILLCVTLLAIGSSFPIAMSGKALGVLLWLVASAVALGMGMTRWQVLAKPTLALTLLFAVSFFVPVELVVARGHRVGINWSRCEVVGIWSYIDRPKEADQKTYVIIRGCCPILGVEPSGVVKISIPERK